MDERGVPAVGDFGKFDDVRLLGETFHPIVGRMHFENRATVMDLECRLVVRDSGPVCGAHFDQSGPPLTSITSGMR